MSRSGHEEYSSSPGRRLPSITQNEIDMAGLDYAKWRRERHTKSVFGSWADNLWNTVRSKNTELAQWLDPLLQSYYNNDSQEGEILKAAFSIMYDLLRRRGVGQIMDQGYFSSSALSQALPSSFLSVPHNPGAHALLVKDMAKFGKMAMEHEQDHEWVVKEIWKLLPYVLDFDVTALNSDTVENYQSLVKWGARVMYGCLRQQLEQRQS